MVFRHILNFFSGWGGQGSSYSGSYTSNQQQQVLVQQVREQVLEQVGSLVDIIEHIAEHQLERPDPGHLHKKLLRVTSEQDHIINNVQLIVNSLNNDIKYQTPQETQYKQQIANRLIQIAQLNQQLYHVLVSAKNTLNQQHVRENSKQAIHLTQLIRLYVQDFEQYLQQIVRFGANYENLAYNNQSQFFDNKSQYGGHHHHRFGIHRLASHVPGFRHHHHDQEFGSNEYGSQPHHHHRFGLHHLGSKLGFGHHATGSHNSWGNEFSQGFGKKHSKNSWGSQSTPSFGQGFGGNSSQQGGSYGQFGGKHPNDFNLNNPVFGLGELI
ncbi:hypothetical protein CONCODRAFT_19962 [Conidiobolus coronatus NRRL 28638]|uniref:Uncharacterized protein n=1 Tax=Conidiobolus coronatus (strain ATCC 28846 / CBS 209.66 / NRRL 28638) TaxID=796925 RepID=A0A137NVR8_CONC2|nr:hypothetical protein CONCODRAFT_19962 [Conidiobolus coronatus NRRL 28638]|eukprot:KXN66925.1 hypothetical protein CONCODRAFT_19962 [Conidiobolus coronatus NRRL 28638]